MNSWTRTAWIACASVLACTLGGCNATSHERVGGETNWLVCSTDDDCGAGSSCDEGACVLVPAREGLPEATDGGSAGDSAEPNSDAFALIPDLGLRACGPSTDAEPLVDLADPMECETGPCKITGAQAVSALDDSRLLILASLQGGVELGPPHYAVYDENGGIGTFAPFPDSVDVPTLLASGPYVGVSNRASGFVYAWDDGDVRLLDTRPSITGVVAAGPNLTVTGYASPDEGSRRPWLARYDGTAPAQWVADAPSDATPGIDAITEGVAMDSDGNSYMLVGAYLDDNDGWSLFVVSMDANGDHRWTQPLGEWLVNPGIAVANGVVWIAGTGSSTLVLAVRQYDTDGAALGRWDAMAAGLAETPTIPNRTVVVADSLSEHAYVLDAAGEYPGRTAVLRFPRVGEPCVLLEAAGFPADLVLRTSDVVVAGTESVGRAPR